LWLDVLVQATLAGEPAKGYAEGGDMSGSNDNPDTTRREDGHR
jgi:hypothetical protein